MGTKRVTYNQELVDAYDWDRVYKLYLQGVGVPQLMDNVIPKELGLRHRYQVVRILTKRYGDVRRKSNSFLDSVIRDYPEFGDSLVESAARLRSTDRFYSNAKLQNKSKYAAATYCKGIDAQYMDTYHKSLDYANEDSTKWRYLKGGYRLPLFLLFTSGIMAVLSQVLATMMYNQVVEGVGLVLGGKSYDRLAESSTVGTQ